MWVKENAKGFLLTGPLHYFSTGVTGVKDSTQLRVSEPLRYEHTVCAEADYAGSNNVNDMPTTLRTIKLFSHNIDSRNANSSCNLASCFDVFLPTNNPLAS